jgi:hypothetical protein
MPSPFPGMDAYLEDDALWPLFHHQFVSCLYQILLPGLVDRYRARVNQRHYVTEEEQSGSVTRTEHSEDYIEIRQRSDGRLMRQCAPSTQRLRDHFSNFSLAFNQDFNETTFT